MRYAIARYEKDQEELAYRIYITDSLYLFAQGKAASSRYYDIISKKQEENTEQGDGLDVAKNILSRAGVEVITEDG